MCDESGSNNDSGSDSSSTSDDDDDDGPITNLKHCSKQIIGDSSSSSESESIDKKYFFDEAR